MFPCATSAIAGGYDQFSGFEKTDLPVHSLE